MYLILRYGIGYSSEKKYLVSFLFGLLGVDVRSEEGGDVHDYMLSYGSGVIQIKDSFFGKQKDENVAKKDNLPTRPVYISSSPWFKNLCFLYGEDVFEISDRQIYCGGDIFGSAFFMLTRWEELVLPKDRFGRCDENEMFVVKHGLHERPIVNEYLCLLEKMLEHIGYPLPKKRRRFSVRLTHDIDYLFRYDLKNMCANLAGDLLHRKSIKAFGHTLKNYLRFKQGKAKDPFDTFDWFMDLSESCGLKDEFYFKAAIQGEYDCTYDVRDGRVKQIMQHVIERGHEVGFHPSKNTFHHPEQFEKEIGRLRSLGFEIKGGRQHFLLYDLPETMRTWSENGLEYDTGLGFYARVGFRCGCCFSYPYWDVEQRKELPIIVRPMTIMEGTLFTQDASVESLKEKMCALVDVVKQYEGEFVFLWHNDNLGREQFCHFSEVYVGVINHIKGLMR